MHVLILTACVHNKNIRIYNNKQDSFIVIMNKLSFKNIKLSPENQTIAHQSIYGEWIENKNKIKFYFEMGWLKWSKRRVSIVTFHPQTAHHSTVRQWLIERVLLGQFDPCQQPNIPNKNKHDKLFKNKINFEYNK